jgi:hypothetical protein
MANDGSSTSPTETVTLQLPSGESVDALVPQGMKDEDVKSLMQQKHPEYFQKAAPAAAAPAPRVLGKADRNPSIDEIKNDPNNQRLWNQPNDELRQFGSDFRAHPIKTIGKTLLQAAPIAAAFLGSENFEAPEAVPINVKGPGEIAPEMVRPRAYFGGQRAEPIPTRQGLALPPASTPATPEAVPITRSAVSQSVDRAFGVEPLKPGVPIRNQFPAQSSPGATAIKTNIRSARGIPAGGTSELPQPIPRTPAPPAESSAVGSFRYDPTTKEMHITGKGAEARTYVYGEVTPEQAEMMKNAESKGMAWKSIKDNNPYVAKIVDGKRIPIRPAKPSASEDLTPILQQSLATAKAIR